MEIMKFISRLNPRIERNQVLEDIEVTTNEFKTGVIPSYQSAQLFLKAAGFRSKEVKDLQTVFYRNFDVKGSRKQENMVAEVNAVIPQVQENLNYINDQIEEIFARDIIKSGLTLRKAALLRAVAHIGFVARFAIDLLNLVYVYEAQESHVDISDAFKGNDKLNENVHKNLFIFAKLLSIYGQSSEKFREKFFDLPDAVINDETIKHISSVYEGVDPIPQAVISGFEGNPIYHLRMVIAEWQAERYKSFKDKKKMLELRLLHLKLLQQEKSDPSVEREIEYIQNRVEGIEYKLKKMED